MLCLSILAERATVRLRGVGGTDRVRYRQSPYDGGTGQLFLSNANGTGQVALTVTDYGGNNSQPAWSPNGSRIAFESKRRGDTDLWSVAPTHRA